MKKTFALLLALAIAFTSAVTLFHAAARADMVYIIPDSSTRELTEEELWDYQYDTLMFAFNEIFARHGYKFETGSRCYNWFTQMPWYVPNEEESSKSHSRSLNACSKLEWKNVNLIKQVRANMKAVGTTNPTGKGMPTPPSRNLKEMNGFTYVKLKEKQKLAVYSAPSENSFRAANGKASVSTNGAIYTMGWDNGWLLIIYETNTGQCRVGYVNGSKIKGKIPSLPQLALAHVSCEVVTDTFMTDDPAKTENPVTRLSAGMQVTYLTTMYNAAAWDYIETTINGQTTRGFVPSGTLSIDDVSELDAVDEMEQMDESDWGDNG